MIYQCFKKKIYSLTEASYNQKKIVCFCLSNARIFTSQNNEVPAAEGIAAGVGDFAKSMTTSKGCFATDPGGLHTYSPWRGTENIIK